jgi:hypothetical protein
MTSPAIITVAITGAVPSCAEARQLLNLPPA